MFFTAYAFKGQVRVFGGWVKIEKSLVLQDKRNIKMFLSPVWYRQAVLNQIRGALLYASVL